MVRRMTLLQIKEAASIRDIVQHQTNGRDRCTPSMRFDRTARSLVSILHAHGVLGSVFYFSLVNSVLEFKTEAFLRNKPNRV